MCAHRFFVDICTDYCYDETSGGVALLSHSFASVSTPGDGTCYHLPPSKMSAYGMLVFEGCLCLLPPNPRKRTYAFVFKPPLTTLENEAQTLIFEGSYLFAMSTTFINSQLPRHALVLEGDTPSTPSKAHALVIEGGCCLAPPPQNERTHLFSRVLAPPPPVTSMYARFLWFQGPPTTSKTSLLGRFRG